MDGRRFRRWCLYGGLCIAAVGCNRNSYHDNFGMPKPGQTVGPIAPATPPSGLARKPMFGKTPPAALPPSQTAVSTQIEMAPPKRSGKGFSPDGEVAMADVHVAAAFADPPPTNKDELLDMARQRYQKALKEDSKNKGALLGMARLYVKLGEKERALEAYKKYMSAHPKDHEVPHEVAMAYGRWNDWNGAIPWCDAALKIDPENRGYKKTKGFCQARTGRWEDAFATFRQIMPEAQARYNLARVMEHLNYPEQSRQWTQMALQADPNLVEAQEFLAELDQGYQFRPNTAGPNNPVMQTGGQRQQP